MGRRKIEIKAIKDDRNRSVTFLKRKGGLFKKAHELSVLCSVDVTVIIFGHNKKLYEFSSGNIQETLGRYQYYGQAHEHKGPADFAGKSNMDDDDDEDISPPPDEMQVQHHPVGPPMQNHAAFQHVNHTASASPPISQNGIQYHHTRNGTPQPANGSRPSSRNNIHRLPANVVAQQHQHPHPHSTPPPAANGYAYVQNPPMYNAQVNPQQPPQQAQFAYPAPPVTQQHAQQPPMAQHPHPLPHHAYHPHHMGQPVQHQQHPPPPPPPGPQHHPGAHPHPHPHPHQAQHVQEHQRRQSMPPAFRPNERQMGHPEQALAPPPPPPPPSQDHSQTQQNPSPPPPRPQQTKSRSIFTPIDDNRSVLAQHFLFGPPVESPKSDSPPGKNSQDSEATTSAPSIPARTQAAPPRPPRSNPNPPQRTQSLSSIPELPGITRTNSGLQRPELKLQIPSNNSDSGSGTADTSSPRDPKTAVMTPARANGDEPRSAVVLPPPSPSAGAILSAGASGPPNPFARPPPPTTNTNGDTPISALPSRFVSDALLPSPSVFYSEWGFGRTGPDSNMLPSPLTFPTPVMQSGPGMPRDSDDPERKRKTPEGPVGIHDGSALKRLKVD